MTALERWIAPAVDIQGENVACFGSRRVMITDITDIARKWEVTCDEVTIHRAGPSHTFDKSNELPGLSDVSDADLRSMVVVGWVKPGKGAATALPDEGTYANQDRYTAIQLNVGANVQPTLQCHPEYWAIAHPEKIQKRIPRDRVDAHRVRTATTAP